MLTNHWRLDPAKFPKRIDLELTEEVYGHLIAISQRTGRSISEIAVEILGQSIDTPLTRDINADGT
jgi:hypothetical protein